MVTGALDGAHALSLLLRPAAQDEPELRPCLAAVLMDSKHQGNVRIETPQLEIAYPTPTTEPIRPRNPRPTGASTVASAEFLSDFVSLLRNGFPALPLRKLVQVSEARLGVRAPQYSHGDFPEYLKRPQPFKDVPRL